MAHERNPWVTFRATGALPSPHSPCPPPAPAAVPPFSSHFQYWHLPRPNCGFSQLPQEEGPLHDNYQLESESSFGQWDKAYSEEHNQGKLILFLRGGVTNLPLTKLDHAAFAGPQKKQPHPTLLTTKPTLKKLSPEGRPFKNFSLGTCNGNKVLPCFHLSNLRLPYGILILNSKLSRCLSEGIIGD